jgi:hypothetical protein
MSWRVSFLTIVEYGDSVIHVRRLAENVFSVKPILFNPSNTTLDKYWDTPCSAIHLAVAVFQFGLQEKITTLCKRQPIQRPDTTPDHVGLLDRTWSGETNVFMLFYLYSFPSVDDKSQRMFYFNMLTKESSWINPTRELIGFVSRHFFMRYREWRNTCATVSNICRQSSNNSQAFIFLAA